MFTEMRCAFAEERWKSNDSVWESEAPLPDDALFTQWQRGNAGVYKRHTQTPGELMGVATRALGVEAGKHQIAAQLPERNALDRILYVMDGKRGVDPTHPALQGHLLPGHDFVDDDNDPTEVGTQQGGPYGHGTHVAGLIAFGAPNIDSLSPAPAQVQWPKDNTARFRDGKPWPEAIAGANRDPKGRATGTEGGYTIINARRIWDADPNHQTISYSTDQNAADLVVLEHELKSFSIVFSMADIHKIIGPNSARYVGLADQIGTLEAGKLADIILIDGNPTLNIYEMLKTKVVLKEGKVVVDKR
jgi:hypothetical protein